MNDDTLLDSELSHYNTLELKKNVMPSLVSSAALLQRIIILSYKLWEFYYFFSFCMQNEKRVKNWPAKKKVDISAKGTNFMYIKIKCGKLWILHISQRLAYFDRIWVEIKTKETESLSLAQHKTWIIVTFYSHFLCIIHFSIAFTLL